jgi:RHS repeat-associated protein
VKTAVNGTEAERWDHYPYGETWVPGGSGDQHRYTGHLRDAESGNDYAGARYYSNICGRWLSVDPVAGDLANPQRLNRYAYVLNNPINYLDPDGRGEEPFDTGFRIVVSSGALYATVYVQALSHSLFGVPQRPGKTALDKGDNLPPDYEQGWRSSGWRSVRGCKDHFEAFISQYESARQKYTDAGWDVRGMEQARDALREGLRHLRFIWFQDLDLDNGLYGMIKEYGYVWTGFVDIAKHRADFGDNWQMELSATFLEEIAHAGFDRLKPQPISELQDAWIEDLRKLYFSWTVSHQRDDYCSLDEPEGG